ncbi:MAG: TIGR01777 family oxidoreductase [Gammaproteobacteria bacterium]
MSIPLCKGYYKAAIDFFMTIFSRVLTEGQQIMKYLITGGTGFIGQHFLTSRFGEEDSVTVLSRKTVNTNSCYRIINDLSVIDDSEVFDCIINLAGAPIDCLWTKKNKSLLIDSRVETTKLLINLIKRLKTKPKVMLSASAIGFYGNYDQAVLDEDSAGRSSFTHELCDKWEREALKAQDYSLRVCIMRFGVVLGKDGGFIKKTYYPFKFGLGGKIGDGEQLFSWIHIDDVIASMKFIIQHKDCSGVYNVVSPNAVTNKALTQYMGKLLNRPTLLSMPAFLIKGLLGEMGENLLLKGNRVCPKKLLAEGYEFKFADIEMALKDIYLC